MSGHSLASRVEPVDLDSTQTLRELTPAELDDATQPQWHVVQLVVSNRPVNLDMMPRLEIFAAHCLYVVVGQHGSATRYALRLGFFPDEGAANAVCGYVQTFFASPSIVRVSAAEHARFAPPASAEPVPVSTPAVARQVQRPPVTHQAVTHQSVTHQAAPSRSTQIAKPSGTQKPTKHKTLAQELLEEARQLQRLKTGKAHSAPRNSSWLSRLLGGAK